MVWCRWFRPEQYVQGIVAKIAGVDKVAVTGEGAYTSPSSARYPYVDVAVIEYVPEGPHVELDVRMESEMSARACDLVRSGLFEEWREPTAAGRPASRPSRSRS